MSKKYWKKVKRIHKQLREQLSTPASYLDLGNIDILDKQPEVKQAICKLLSECGQNGYTVNEIIEQLKDMVEGTFTLRYVEPILKEYVQKGQMGTSIKRERISDKPQIKVSLTRPGLLYRPTYKTDFNSQYREIVYYHYIPPEQRERQQKDNKQSIPPSGTEKQNTSKKAKNHKGTSKILKKRIEYRLDFNGQKVSVYATGNHIVVPQMTLRLLPVEFFKSGEIAYEQFREIVTASLDSVQNEMLELMDQLAELQATLNRNMEIYGGSKETT
ncbi:hypothetical protein [Vampirovibrio chlorellavorus]|uniref:hypothetical protein n=1 Tax=Vampirovibrio chlorellavorus TaxID=758823 RepID=UPI0026EC6D59|nr:hypothetical protein [Vampirovibrio chlorellavorus]